MKYVKKRIPIEAYQTKAEMYIETLEGTMHASVGDYIITGVNGERYPCKPDIFEKTYEPYEEDAVSRKMAMDAITASTPYCVVPDDYHISVVDMEFRISTLPSVTPKQKAGKAVVKSGGEKGFWVCNQCGGGASTLGINIARSAGQS